MTSLALFYPRGPLPLLTRGDPCLVLPAGTLALFYPQGPRSESVLCRDGLFSQLQWVLARSVRLKIGINYYYYYLI